MCYCILEFKCYRRHICVQIHVSFLLSFLLHRVVSYLFSLSGRGRKLLAFFHYLVVVVSADNVCFS